MKTLFISLIFCLLYLLSCKPLPTEKLSQWEQEINYEVNSDTLHINIKNDLHSPVRVWAYPQNDSLEKILKQDFPLVLPARVDTVLRYWTDKQKDNIRIAFGFTFGDPRDSIQPKALELPFPKGKEYKVIQGYNGKFSHTDSYSRYALDFELLEYDTICAAAEGYVVGVIEDYKYGGFSKKWRDYANFITLFHPEMNIYTQYVHLTYKGSFVDVGDRIESGQAIGLSGQTGFTSTEHLHFNVLVPTEDGLSSIKAQFKEGYNGSNLKRGAWVKK
jgi:murein DD-endopeptidase MepM/ murein hydrolase activator NlpD